MKTVKIYDQYSPVYADKQNNNSLTTLSLSYNEPLNSERYDLIHESSGSVSIQGSNLSESDANNLVNTLYEKTKTLGTSYTDKIVDIDSGYAELKVEFADGKKLNRVIYTENE